MRVHAMFGVWQMISISPPRGGGHIRQVLNLRDNI